MPRPRHLQEPAGRPAASAEGRVVRGLPGPHDTLVLDGLEVDPETGRTRARLRRLEAGDRVGPALLREDR